MGLHATGREDASLAHSATRAFGSWRDAVRAAGLEATQRRRWTRQAILAELERRKEQCLPLHASAVEDDLPGLYGAAFRLFGSYAATARRFGKLAARPVHRRWTRESIVQEIRSRARDGKVPEGALKGALTSACQEVCGSVSAARIAAGLPGLVKWSPERVRREIRRFAKVASQAGANAGP